MCTEYIIESMFFSGCRPVGLVGYSHVIRIAFPGTFKSVAIEETQGLQMQVSDVYRDGPKRTSSHVLNQIWTEHQSLNQINVCANLPIKASQILFKFTVVNRLSGLKPRILYLSVLVGRGIRVLASEVRLSLMASVDEFLFAVYEYDGLLNIHCLLIPLL